MAGLVPATHVLLRRLNKSWLPGTSPGMTTTGCDNRPGALTPAADWHLIASTRTCPQRGMVQASDTCRRRRPSPRRLPHPSQGGTAMNKRWILAGALALAASLAQAQEVKVGLVVPYTGVGAELGQQVTQGAELFLKLNADKIKPYTIRLIKRDDKDASGATSRTVVQELLTQDNVDALAGWVYSPNAIAS